MTAQLTIGELCAGYGGLGMAVEEVFGARLAWVSEYEAAPSRILAHHWPDVPNHGDMTKIDWAVVEPVDIISGGTPCQDLSHAGKRAGMTEGTRSNLWVQMREAIATIRPRFVVWENVRGAFSAAADSEVEPCPGCVGDGSAVNLRALGRVLGDLSDLGYDAGWHGLTASSVGAPHGRFRVFVVAWDADPNTARVGRRSSGRDDRVRTQGLVEELASNPGSEARALGAGLRADEARRVGGARSDDSDRSTADAISGGQHGRSRDPLRRAGGRAAAAGGGKDTLADTDDQGPQRAQPARRRDMLDGGPSSDAASNGRNEGRAESAGLIGGPDAALGGDVASDADRLDLRVEPVAEPGSGSEAITEHLVQWGQFGPAIRRWDAVLNREAPAPTEIGPKGGQRLSPRFVEWMMGLPAGHVTSIPSITRNDQLKALGNGVVPQQAIAAVRHILNAVASERAA